MTYQDFINIGFKPIPHSTITNSVILQLGRNRHLSAGCVDSPNETLWICATNPDEENEITDLICLHNWDYDGDLTIEKVQAIINAIGTSLS